ncbi:Surfactin synthase thioesterase subunit [Filimonas lacunae]|uniref:Surfactin synthase thioesterase subunit n=1 Tax=Filimonas lacunae TaxID=477680 RepID=A0A173MEB7_9BACT|nr:alpha/beta fold hydrolase [Filimonas lacunae]BAV05934.1 thioesterase [Filimonas lacunae]SIT23786.1 Surfactin synthase thioesterase subunit [Filimonas lacunae]
MIKPQLFLLHFAGGNCYSYLPLSALLKEFDVVSLELPGRGQRLDEPLLKDYDLAVQDIFHQITSKLSGARFMLYGHSMGAYLALSVCAMLEDAGKYPAYLVVSGNAGPGLREKRNTYLLEHRLFWKEVQSLGGIADELLASMEWVALFEPVLRADYEIVEREDMDTSTLVQAPIYALMGDKEEQVEAIGNWGRYTASAFEWVILKGDHFFIFSQAAALTNAIKKCYATVTVTVIPS